jgi:vancomycin permeability regulator SanA
LGLPVWCSFLDYGKWHYLFATAWACNSLGVQSVGAKSDIGTYYRASWFNLREMSATMLALWDIVLAGENSDQP